MPICKVNRMLLKGGKKVLTFARTGFIIFVRAKVR
nr:MAG TPA: hypothetical protein [Caudoviricetes sp.]